MSVIAATAAQFQAPTLNWAALAPLLFVLGAGVVGVLVEAFAPRRARWLTQLVLSLGALLASFVALVLLWDDPPFSIGELGGATGGQPGVPLVSVLMDRPAIFLQATLVLLSILAVLTMAERGGDAEAFAPQGSSVPGSVFEDAARRAGLNQTEIFPLMMFAVGGLMVFSSAGDLLTMFVGLEVFSLPLYILCGLARRRRLLSQEASLKYFLLGAFSSALFLFGIALLYGFNGTVNLYEMRQVLTPERVLQQDGNTLALVVGGVVLVMAGLLFKIGAVPFHSWTPDVYTGAPTSVTGFMAACTKIAAFGALMRVLFVGLGGLQDTWQPIVLVVSAVTMVLGSVVAIWQTDMKRMLAYSAIAHAGFVLTALVAVQTIGLSSMLFYLVAYGFTTIGAFAVVTLLRERDELGNVTGEATHLSQWAGLGRRSPVLAAVFTLFLLAFAGIPLTSGFTSKFAVFSAAVSGGQAWLAVVGVLMSAVSAFFYVRVIVLMYFTDAPAGATTVVRARPFTSIAVAVGVAATLLLGIVPAPVLALAGSAAGISASATAEAP